jgi:large subunit ribosomal protein L19e
MANLRHQKRLAACVLKCGKRRVFLDPNEASEIALATSRRSMKKLVKDGLVIKKGVKIHSRARARLFQIAKRRGRHTGVGKRRGARDARLPVKILWIRRQRSLRRLLRKYRKAGKIDKQLYHQCYLNSKGNQYKNKRVLVEAIHRERNEKNRADQLKTQMDARRTKNTESRKKKLEKKTGATKAAQKGETK